MYGAVGIRHIYRVVGIKPIYGVVGFKHMYVYIYIYTLSCKDPNVIPTSVQLIFFHKTSISLR